MPALLSTTPRRKSRSESAELPVPLAAMASSARVAGLDAQHRVLVNLPGTPAPTPARLLRGMRRHELFDTAGAGREVLVVFDAARDGQPVIVGLLEPEPSTGAGARPESEDERTVIEAQGELVLKCGAGSITLRQDGKIVLRGTHLLSRSSGPIRIKGGHVEIN